RRSLENVDEQRRDGSHKHRAENSARGAADNPYRRRDNKAQWADLEVGIVRVEMQSSGERRPPAVLAEDELAAVDEVAPVGSCAADVLEAGAKCGNGQDHIAPPDHSTEHGREMRQAALVDQGHEA